MAINDLAPGQLVAPWLTPGGGELGGSYVANLSMGPFSTLAAGTQIASVAWQDTTKAMVITGFGLQAFCTTAFTTAQYVAMVANISRQNKSLATGGTNVYASSIERVKTSMPLSALNNIMTANAGSTPLTAPTQILGNSLLTAQFWAGVLGASSQQLNPLSLMIGQGSPIILVAGDGVEILNGILMGAAGAVQVGIFMTWMEVPMSLINQYYGQ